MDLLAIAGAAAAEGLTLSAAAEGGEPAQFQINLFWIIMQALSFLVFLAILYVAAFRRIGGVLEDRRQRIEQGLADAEQARKDRERAEQERLATLAEARREANEIVTRAQRVAQEARDRDIAATREDLERLRTRATGEIEAEKQRAIADLRAEVADLALAAASKVVGESMNEDRQRRLVQEFLRESAAPGGNPSERRR
ncbi:MAG TPA: F0F1 ATP synthase subunit B [Vitreimonas sp.]|nr:F0F1 ATP synthase subunit B [Vitreimonas sp.]